MNLPSVERYLNSFGKQVVNRAKGNLQKAKGGGTALENSINFSVIKKSGTLTVRFKMAAYGQFLDKGVSGTAKKISYKNRDGKVKPSPFKYTTKAPPIDIISKWIKKKGIKGHGVKRGRSTNTGQFVSGLAYLISKKIKREGIKSLSFFQKPLMLGMKQFTSKFGKAIAEDILNNIK
tara:strand:+ start:1324 stop:1854 length:531 start_codon:yes stop_codon:yes gene_type:complete